MRTTLTLEEDAYLAAVQLARRQGISLGAAVSQLVRQGQQAPAPETRVQPRGRFAIAPARGEVISVEHIRRLMDDEGI